MEEIKPDRLITDTPIDKVENIKDGLSGDGGSGEVDPIKDGTIRRTDKKDVMMKKGMIIGGEYKNPTIRESTQSEVHYDSPSIRDDQHQLSSGSSVQLIKDSEFDPLNSSEVASIKEGSSGDTTHELETITDEVHDTTAPLGMIKDGTQNPAESSTDLIKDGEVGDPTHDLEVIKDGEVTESVHKLEVIKDGEIGDTTHELEVIKDQDHDTTHKLDEIKEGTSGPTEYSTLTITDEEHDTTHDLEVIKDGEQGNTDYTTLMITHEGIDQKYASQALESGQYDELKEDTNITDDPIDNVLTIKDGVVGDSEYSTPNIKDGNVGSSEYSTLSIKDGEQGDTTYDTPNIKDGESGDTTYDTPNIKDGEIGDHEYKTLEVKDGVSGDTSYETPNVKDGVVGDIAYETPNIKSGTSGDTAYETPNVKDGIVGESDYETLSIKEGEVGDSIHEAELIKDGTSSDTTHELEYVVEGEVESTEYETLKINHKGIDQKYSEGELESGRYDELKPDTNVTDDPIDEVVTIKSGTEAEVTEKDEPDKVKAQSEDRVLKTKDDYKVQTLRSNAGQGPDQIAYDRDYELRSTTAEWGQVPFVGDVIGLATSAVNGVAQDLDKLLHDKRYQVYLACQALGNVMVDKIYGSKTLKLSPTQMIMYLNRLKNVFSVGNLLDSAASMLGGLISGKGLNFKIGPLPSPEFQDVVLDHPTSDIENKEAAYSLFNDKYKEVSSDGVNRVIVQKNDGAQQLMRGNASKGTDLDSRAGFPSAYTKPDGTKTALDEFYKEFRKLMYYDGSNTKADASFSYKDKVLQYWDDEGNHMVAPLQGYKSLAGFSLDSAHLWDMSLQPYVGDANGNKTYLPKTPTQSDDGPGWVPALSYDFTDFKMMSKEIDMGMAYDPITIPDGKKRSTVFNTMIVDDQFGNWFKYLRTVSARTSAVKNALVLPYKNVTFELCLYILDPGAHIRYKRQLLVLLDDYESKHTGEEEASIVVFNVQWRIVGEIQKIEE